MTADPIAMRAEARRIAAARPDAVLSFADSRAQRPVPSWVRPVNGAGTWRPSPSHGLRLTALGTFVACLLMAFGFLLAQHVGRQLMCATHHDADGRPTFRYCQGWTPKTETTR